MSSKKKQTKKGKKGGKKNAEIEELRAMIQTLKKEMDTMQKTIKKQNKRISSLETENKRIKKNIQKIQLYPPKESVTLTSDIDQSDIESTSNHYNESKDDDDSKEREEIKTSKNNKPKPVIRRNRTKPKKKAGDIRFTFDMSHQKIKVGDNGSSAMKPKVYGGTIRFGRFINFTKNNTDNIALYTITFDTRSIGQNSSIALGFATKSFNAWIGSNFGQNNCCIVKGTGQFLFTNKVFKMVDGKEYKHKEIAKQLLNTENPKDGFFKDGHDVTVQVDLKNYIGKIWNETLNKDGSDQDKVFEIILPDDYEVCIVAYMGGSAKKKLIVKEQKFVFDE